MKDRDFIRKWANFFMLSIILMLSLFKASASDAIKAVRATNAERAAIWRELCKQHPDCDRTPEPVKAR